MTPLLIKLLLGPALMLAATAATRRWGPRLGGVVAAFPAIVGPLLLVTALEHGARATARAAAGTLLGLVALAGFTVAYAETSRHRGWAVSLGAGWLVAALLTAVAGAWARGGGSAADGLIAGGSLGLAGALLGRRSRAVLAGPSSGSGRGGFAVRATLTGLLVMALSAAVGAFGPVIGGLLAALPVLVSLLAVFTHREAGAEPAVEILRGTLVGMTGFVVFCLLVAVAIGPCGTAGAFTLATAAALLTQVLVARRRPDYSDEARNSGGRSGEASASARFRPSASRSAA